MRRQFIPQMFHVRGGLCFTHELRRSFFRTPQRKHALIFLVFRNPFRLSTLTKVNNHIYIYLHSDFDYKLEERVSVSVLSKEALRLMSILGTQLSCADLSLASKRHWQSVPTNVSARLVVNPLAAYAMPANQCKAKQSIVILLSRHIKNNVINRGYSESSKAQNDC